MSIKSDPGSFIQIKLSKDHWQSSTFSGLAFTGDAMFLNNPVWTLSRRYVFFGFLFLKLSQFLRFHRVHRHPYYIWKEWSLTLICHVTATISHKKSQSWRWSDITGGGQNNFQCYDDTHSQPLRSWLWTPITIYLLHLQCYDGALPHPRRSRLSEAARRIRVLTCRHKRRCRKIQCRDKLQ